jgi:DNA mismatch repair protein MutS2
LDERSLELIEFPEVTAAIAEHAVSERARASLRAWHPIADSAEREHEVERLGEAIRRAAEPDAWVSVGAADLELTLDHLGRRGPEGTRLLEVLGWLEAGAQTLGQWSDAEQRARFPRLEALLPDMAPLEGLRRRLATSLDGDGAVRDEASPALKRLRGEIATGERRLGDHLERWTRSFGPDAYVTRHGERFVAMVPAAGFPRRRGIIHDVSGSGQSLLVEPLEWCGENNRLIESRRAARDEERRILEALGAEVDQHRDAITAMEERLVRLDALAARARWGLAFGGIALRPGGDALVLQAARHPMLAMGVGREKGAVVPLDLELHTERVTGSVLLVSGPNMGGKTVLLKTVGLAVAMAHAALPVTVAEGSRVPELDELLADIGDDQSIAEGLSTFAAHLRALSRMVEAAGPRALLLADELGAGTDPEDGAALARALIEHMATRGSWAVVTTHLGSLKRLAGEIAGVENGSLEFDMEALAPRYRFLSGVPGASHALEVAERLGVPSAVLERARRLRPEGAATADRLLAELAQATRDARSEAERLTAAREEADAAAVEHHAATESLRQEEAALRRRLTRESEAVLARAREIWQRVQTESRKAEKQRVSAESLRREMAEVERDLESLAGPERAAAAAAPLAASAIVPGMRVRVTDLGVEAEVAALPDREGRVQLKRGSWSIQSHVGRLAPAAAAAAANAAPRPVAATWSAPEGAPVEVDLRGMDVADAMTALDRGVDHAVLAGLGEVRVIHGVGRGVLRGAVERYLREHPQVSGQRPGEVGEGGRGVTVARLR